jgi:hypothetical protein
MEWFNRPDFGEEPRLWSIVFSTYLVDLNLEYSSRSGFGTLISLVFFQLYAFIPGDVPWSKIKLPFTGSGRNFQI